MAATTIGARVLSAKRQPDTEDGNSAWLFGVVLESEIDGHTRWIVETADVDAVNQLLAAFENGQQTTISCDLLVDPAVNAVD
jgi:hypothetical protein